MGGCPHGDAVKPYGIPLPPPLVPPDSKVVSKLPNCPTNSPMFLLINTALPSIDSSLFPSSPLPLLLKTFPAMLSTFPADCLLGNPFEPGFPSWDTPFLFHMEEEPAVFSHEPVTSNSGSDTLNPTPCSGSDDSNRNEPRTLTSGSGSGSGSGSDDENRDKFKNKRLGCDVLVDERKRRRMLSNRESARRSRKRKQKHLENLRNQANRLMLGNREQTNRLRSIVYQTQLFRRENNFLRTEAAVLRQRLWDIRQVLAVRQLQQLLNPMHMQNNNPTL